MPPPQFLIDRTSLKTLTPPWLAINSSRGGSVQIAGATDGNVVNVWFKPNPKPALFWATSRKKYRVPGDRPAKSRLTDNGFVPDPTLWGCVEFPYAAVVPHSNQMVVAEPLGLTVPFRVALFSPKLEAEFVVAVGR
jgi:hypothetical protein